MSSRLVGKGGIIVNQDGTRLKACAHAKKCYEHLGGKLGELIFNRLIELEWFQPEDGNVSVYQVTEKGYQELRKLGVDLEK